MLLYDGHSRCYRGDRISVSEEAYRQALTGWLTTHGVDVETATPLERKLAQEYTGFERNWSVRSDGVSPLCAGCGQTVTQKEESRLRSVRVCGIPVFYHADTCSAIALTFSSRIARASK